ncbi:MAG: tRNA dihydrouridine synthase DusB [Mariprofundales bacterium]|nr:tRNA dihydrouridine synthase DusB [Mariprofundales bacterium]
MTASFHRLPPIQIGAICIDPPLLLAPMAGITDLPFRTICRRYGVGMTVTEMIASRAVEQKRPRTENMAVVGEDESPVAVQIAGSDPDYLSQAARWAVAHGADMVDINMGCPVKKICKQVAGSALLKDEPKVAELLRAVVAAVEVPVTLKVRTGWDQTSKNVAQIARIAEESGVQMLTVHGRTRAQMFQGDANWEDIGLAVDAVTIPVIGNGDVVDGASARELVRVSGCAGVMVGRAVQGNPWLMGEVAAALRGESCPPPPSNEERWAVVEEHMQRLATHHGEFRASQLVRKHVVWYSKGMLHSAQFRGHFQRLRSWQEQRDTARDYFLSNGQVLAHVA